MTEVNYFFFLAAFFFLVAFLAFFFAAMVNSSIVCSGLNDTVAPQNVTNMKYLHFEMQLYLAVSKTAENAKFRKPAFYKG